MMELVSIVAGIICGILAGVLVSLVLLLWETKFDAKQARRRETLMDVQQILQLWQASQGTTRQFTIVERRLLEDGKRR